MTTVLLRCNDLVVRSPDSKWYNSSNRKEVVPSVVSDAIVAGDVVERKGVKKPKVNILKARSIGAAPRIVSHKVEHLQSKHRCRLRRRIHAVDVLLI